ncbi:hypothetical protein GCM10011317_52730 [Niveispirillum cyanobacteriorum]|nr:hypothetical protein GCM10011317_52730 [Niveispirillum cyanobacteriorum]
MVDLSHSSLSVVRQCPLLSISHSHYYGSVWGEGAGNLALIGVIDAQFLETPWYDSRQTTYYVRSGSSSIANRSPLMGRMELAALYQRLKTNVPHSEHNIWFYLLRNLTIDWPYCI